MYWCTDVCTAVYITVSLYIDDVLMSVNSIHSLYHNITCQTTILESTEVLMMYRCTNVSLSISVFNVADHKQLSRWYTRCDVWCIHKLLYYYINYTLVCKDAVCKNYHFTVYWCTDVLMSVLLYISLYRCISMYRWTNVSLSISVSMYPQTHTPTWKIPVTPKSTSVNLYQRWTTKNDAKKNNDEQLHMI